MCAYPMKKATNPRGATHIPLHVVITDQTLLFCTQSKLEKPGIRHLLKHFTFSFLVYALFQFYRNPYINTWNKKQSLGLLLLCVFLGAEGVGVVRTSRSPGIVGIGNKFVSLALVLHSKCCSQFSYMDFLQ